MQTRPNILRKKHGQKLRNWCGYMVDIFPSLENMNLWQKLYFSTKSSAEDREYIIDSTAYLHTISRISPTPGEKKTRESASNHRVVMTANGTVEAHQEARVYLKDWDIFVCVIVVDDSPARRRQLFARLVITNYGRLIDRPEMRRDGLEVTRKFGEESENLPPVEKRTQKAK